MAALPGFPEARGGVDLFESFRGISFLLDIVIFFLIVPFFLILVLLSVMLFVSDFSSDSSSDFLLVWVSVILKFLRSKDLFFSYFLCLSF